MTELLSALGGVMGIGTFVWYGINLREKRTIERASAKSAEAEADGKVADNWRKFAEKMEEQYYALSARVNLLEESLRDYSSCLALNMAKKKYAEGIICTRGDDECDRRKPARGSFVSDDDVPEDKHQKSAINV